VAAEVELAEKDPVVSLDELTTFVYINKDRKCWPM
jgi:hypothetical protein